MDRKKSRLHKRPHRHLLFAALLSGLSAALIFPASLLLNCSDPAAQLNYNESGTDRTDKGGSLDDKESRPTIVVHIEQGLEEVWTGAETLPEEITPIVYTCRRHSSEDETPSKDQYNTKNLDNPARQYSFEEREVIGELYITSDGNNNRFSSSGEKELLAKVLRRSYFAPAVPLWDTRSSVTLSEALDSRELEPKPVEEIAPPEKALRIEGMRIDDAEYPLVEEVHAALTLRGESLHSRKVKEWFLTEVGEASAPPKIVSLGGVGDLMVGRGIEDILISRGNEAGLSYIFGDTLPILREQDILVGNLEGAVTRSNTAVPKSYNFKFRPEVLPFLKDAGFDYLSLTNNHCYDYGERGFLDTLDYLEEYGLSTSGAGRSVEEAHQPAFLAPNLRILSVGDYPKENNGFDGRAEAQVSDTRAGILFSGPEVLKTIEEFSSPDTIDVVAVHGGVEWRSKPTEAQREFYRSCVDAGADLVLGSHPHVLQGIEGYRGGIIAYSLGNFLFPGMYVMENAEDSLILSVGFVEGRPLYIEPYPVKINNRHIELDKGGAILHRLSSLTEELH
ncbi:MAG: CapA family protein [Spirochaetaceae bacterium]